MKQVLQNLKTGQTEVVSVPQPRVNRGCLLIQSRKSVVSAGTEKMLVDFGKSNMIEKARQQPDKVRQVMGKLKTDGLIPTIQAVKAKLDQPMTLGYSNAGVVIAVGEGVEGFSIGDRVVSNGPHAEFVNVPINLCAKIPDNVSDEDAAFTVIASIGLQGIRLAQPTLGETFVVTGLGLIGLLTVQLLKAHGCKVIGIDFNPERLKLAQQFGAEIVDLSKAEDPVAAAVYYTQGRGVDGVIITASTRSSDPVHQAAHMCRKRGRIILVGVTGLELSRADFYEKELTFQVSCSYGPGRYDTGYEQKGLDYPIGFVRWTEQRNFEAVLDMFAEGKLNVESLITHRFTIDQAPEAYEVLSRGESLGIVIQYPAEESATQRTIRLMAEGDSGTAAHDIRIGMIGAGNYTHQSLMPLLKKTGVTLHTIASSGGVNSVHVGKKFGFYYATSDIQELIHHPEINTVMITTRHNTHAQFVVKALHAGKHVFVEKPLCLTEEELDQIQLAKQQTRQKFMLGFNRRFAPHVMKMKELLESHVGPKSFIVTVNAGYIPADHWTQDPEIGGGRIVGEACHYLDLLRYLAGCPIADIKTAAVHHKASVVEDVATITLLFLDGSIGTIHYFANGHKGFPKERVKVFSDGKILVLDNFKDLRGYGWKNFKRMKLWSQDKGHFNGIQAFFKAITEGKEDPIPFSEICEVTRASFDAARMIREAKK